MGCSWLCTITSFLFLLFIPFLPFRVVKFSSVTHLTIHFPSNFGEETTKVSYIGFRGEYTKAHRHGVTICNYELSPQMMDHKDKALDSVGKPIM